MLIQFSVTNFQCIKERVTLDIRLTEYQDTLIDDRLLPIAAIYGPNGGGKSTILKALSVLRSLIGRHFIAMGDNIIRLESIIPFKFDTECLNRPTEFEIFIENKGIEYKYYIAILNNQIVDESLYFRKVGSEAIKEAFTRHNNDITLGAALKGEVKVVNNISDSMPLLAMIGLLYKVQLIENLKEWFLSTMIVDYNLPFQDEILLEGIYQLELNVNERTLRIKDRVLDLLRGMDINITSFRTEKIQVTPTRPKIKISTVHSVDGISYELDLQEESNGTRKIFALLPIFVMALERGNNVIIDELDAKIHPKLLKFIIELFTRKDINTNGAQLVFTSHDLTTMTKEVFRRDEIWFMAMCKQEYSQLYSLTDIRAENGELVRKDAAYNKQYIEGRYGADPYLNAIKLWEV